jgi:flagellar basal-body rod protein FlgB
VLSANIANADTPGWRPRDVAPFVQTLSAFSAGPVLARAQGAYLSGTIDAGAPAAAAGKPSQIAPDGNAVVIEDELTKVADTQGAQAVAANLYSKYMGFFRLALGRAGA